MVKALLKATLLMGMLFHIETLHAEKLGSWFFVGIDGGLQSKDDVKEPEVTNSGYALGLKAVYAYYLSRVVFDGGLGLRYDAMEENDVRIQTRSVFADLGIRYQFNSSWSLGLQSQVLMGQDVSFSDTGTNSDDKSTSILVGARVLYDLPVRDGDRKFRLGFEVLTDTDIPDRRITNYLLVLEYGGHLSGGQQAPKEKIVVKEVIKEKVVVKKVPVKVRVKDKKPKGILLNLKDGGVHFATGSAQLIGKSREIIRRLARVLNKYSGYWSYIKVSGHTDVRGDYRTNVKLSRDRAASVRSVFLENGVPEFKITSQGYGPDRPIDPSRNEQAYLLNRRVELNIVSEETHPKFVDLLKKILGDYAIDQRLGVGQ